MEYRNTICINDGWESALAVGDENDSCLLTESMDFKEVTIPHNWEDYHGYHRVTHGNLHGSAWYRRDLEYDRAWNGKRVFLFFEGVGSYADVWVNQIHVGNHKGGRTCFSLEITQALKYENTNRIVVRASHPEKINDLPWICGGCYGSPNTEGSQPMGIFRPVHIVVTGSVRIKPFGVYITTPNLKEGSADVRIDSELVNLAQEPVKGTLLQELLDKKGNVLRTARTEFMLEGKEERSLRQEMPEIENPSLWYPDRPFLYRIRTSVLIQDQVSDLLEDSFGFREITWENFDTGHLEVIDPSRLAEEPGEANQYFVTRQKGSKRSAVAILPGGVKIRIPEFTGDRAVICIETTLVNRDHIPHTVSLESFLQTYNQTKSLASLNTEITLEPGRQRTITQTSPAFLYPDLWTRERPYLHNVVSTVRGIDEPLKEYYQTSTSFGIFESAGIVNKGNAYVPDQTLDSGQKRRFLVNGRHYFLNGTCEYENELGHDHAFSAEMIRARISMLKAAGFTALREAHCPHNLRYLENCEQMGILYWAQMGAHIYFDTDSFRENFLTLTEEWVRERRNSPALILWGIQNESMLPADFTVQVTELIRRLDTTSPSQRKAVTCNGGTGSDWNIPQNWSGTYGGSVENYGIEAVRMGLIGEYGQYRIKGRHEEGSMAQKQNSGAEACEELFAYCLETKVREAEKVRESFYGHFQWIMVSHANPGRELRYCLDATGSGGVGVVNSKGIFTSWGEPTDAYYMYRANYVPSSKTPMLYLVSHTWPDRFTGPCQADIAAYSNCEEVELYNDYGDVPVGRLYKGAPGEHFTFRDVPVRYGILTAKGYCNGKCVAQDRIFFPALPLPRHDEDAEEFSIASSDDDIYRVNCGGESYQDVHGRRWLGDQTLVPGSWGYTSWGTEYENVEDEIGSVGRSWDEVKGCREQRLLQQFRYGREKLSYTFPVENGEYVVELYFIEPWYGLAGEDAAGWRIFDVAVNGRICLRRLDIWGETHEAMKPVRKSFTVKADNGILKISFPNAVSNQAVISAIRITKPGDTNDIVSAQAGSVSVPKGTAAGDLALPFAVDVQLEEPFTTWTQPEPSCFTKVPVIWDTSSFRPQLTEKPQILRGLLSPTPLKTTVSELTPKPISNSRNVEAQIEVIVRDVSRELFVSSTAEAGGDGSRERPFDSIQAAKEAIAAKGYNLNMTGDILVWIEEGTYRITQPIVFGVQDSGSNGYSIIYQGIPGKGLPELSGGVRVTGFKKWEKNPRVYVADLDRSTKLRNLIVNGRHARMTQTTGIQSRGEFGSYTFDSSQDWALDGGCVAAGMRLKWEDLGFVEGTTVENLTNPQDIELEQKKVWNSVSVSLADIISIDHDQFGSDSYGERVGLRLYHDPYYKGLGYSAEVNEAAFKAIYEKKEVQDLIKEADCAAIFSQPYGAIAESLAWRCHLDPYLGQMVRNQVKDTWQKHNVTIRNSLELLKNPGEFYFDRTAHRLYYYPLEGEDIHTSQILAPVSEGLIRICGTGSDSDSQRVVGLTFRRMRFTGDDKDLMHVKDSEGHDSSGFASVQNMVPYTKYISHGRWHDSFYNNTDLPAGCVDVMNAKHIVFEANQFNGLSGTTAVSFVNDVTDSMILGNEFVNNAGNAVNIGHPQHVYIGDDPNDPFVSDNRFPPGVEGLCKNIMIRSNYIENVCMKFIQGDAITSFFVENCEISHNTVQNVPYTALCLGWGWGNWDGRMSSSNPGKASVTARKNTVVYNRFQKTNTELPNDGGPLYTLGQQEDSIIAYNFISDGPASGKRDIYTDEGSAYFEVFGNRMEGHFNNQSGNQVWYQNRCAGQEGQGAFYYRRTNPEDTGSVVRIDLPVPFAGEPVLSEDEITDSTGVERRE